MNFDSLVENMYEKGFFITDNFLPNESFEALQQDIISIQSQDLPRDAKIGPQSVARHNEKIRSDKIYWLDETTKGQLQTYFKSIEELRLLLNRNFFLGLDYFEAHYAIYPPGSFYKKHIDQFATNKERRISCVYYLNEHWDSSFGGELLLYNTQDKLIETCLPVGNRFICFESCLPHEVNVAHKTRYSIATWLRVKACR